MKKIILSIAILLTLATLAISQGSSYSTGQVITSSTTAPSGNCSLGSFYIYTGVPTLSVCGPTANTWTPISLVLSCQQSTTDTLSAATITTTETAFATTYTIPANYLVANRTLRITATFSVTSSGSAPTSTIKLRITNASGTTLYSHTPASPGNNLAGKGGGFQWIMSGTVAAGASANVITQPTVAPTNFGFGSTVGNLTAQPIALATNGNIVLVITQQYSANTSGNTVTLNQLCIEGMN